MRECVHSLEALVEVGACVGVVLLGVRMLLLRLLGELVVVRRLQRKVARGRQWRPVGGGIGNTRRV